MIEKRCVHKWKYACQRQLIFGRPLFFWQQFCFAPLKSQRFYFQQKRVQCFLHGRSQLLVCQEIINDLNEGRQYAVKDQMHGTINEGVDGQPTVQFFWHVGSCPSHD